MNIRISNRIRIEPRRKKSGDVVYAANAFVVGWTLMLPGLVAGWLAFEAYSGQLFVLIPELIEPMGQWFAHIASAIATVCLIGALACFFRRKTLIFHPRDRKMDLRDTSLIRRRRQEFEYKDLAARLTNESLHSGPGLNYSAFTLTISWDGGKMPLERNDSRMQVQQSAAEFERATCLLLKTKS